MCYDIRYLTRAKNDYQKRFEYLGTNLNIIDEVGGGEKLEAVYHTTGFEHRSVPVITNQQPEEISFFRWGLIPFWTKDQKTAEQISNKTLNAKGEELSEKPSFRSPAKSKRCLVMVDGFFEHHHQGKNTFPYHILRKDEVPFALAGLWERWENKDEEEVHYTFSIVTTKANKLLSEIHNNPKLSEPRMPVIIRQELDEVWLRDGELKDIEWKKIMEPFPADGLQAYTVPKLRGKEASGNKPGAVRPTDYPELNSLFD